MTSCVGRHVTHTDLETFVHEGCEYLVNYKGAITHKGNCTNQIHKCQ